MRIEQEIFKFYEKLTLKGIVKHLQYKLSYNIQFISILFCYLLFLIFDICAISGIFFPLLKENANILIGGAISFLILAYILTLKTKHFSLQTIANNKKIIDINDIKQEAISIYLTKMKYITKNKDNSQFYSDIIQTMQFHSTYLYNKSTNIHSTNIIGILLTILTFTSNKLGELHELSRFENVILIIASILTFMFISSILIVANLQSKSRIIKRQCKYNELYLILLDLKLKDSLHKNTNHKMKSLSKY